MFFFTGTSRVAEPYKVGKRMTDILLEILNLNKTEVISIDIISNQEFTEVSDISYMLFLLSASCAKEELRGLQSFLVWIQKVTFRRLLT